MTFYRLTISETTMICHSKQKQKQKFTMSSFQVTKKKIQCLHVKSQKQQTLIS